MGTAGGAGDGLRRLRLLAGYSIRGLADAAGISFHKVVRAERNGYAPLATVQALASVLGPAVRRTLVVRPAPRASADVNAVMAARQRMDLSRSAMAKRIGVSDKVLARAEAGRPIRPANAKRIALALGLDMATVLDLGNDGKAA